LDLPIDDFNADMAVNAASPFASVVEAVKGFKELKTNGELGKSGATFIFTGNMLNDSAGPNFMTFGMGKSAAAFLIKSLALVDYVDEPFK
jgi:NAD(P)-dependent dehydrogenase (short-subunit alcohol dehydrogenase family)